MTGTLTPRRMVVLIFLLAMATFLSDSYVSAGSVDGITDLSSDRSMTISDMAVEGDEVYIVAILREADSGSVQFRHFDGARWQPWMWVSSVLHESAYGAEIAVENGTAHMVYLAEFSQDKIGIFHRAFHNGNLSPEVRVDLDSGTWVQRRWAPDVAVDGGIVHVVWDQSSGGEMGIIYRRLDQTGWDDTQIIGTEGFGISVSSPMVVAEGNKIHVAWVRYDGSENLRNVVYRYFDGSLWSNLKRASTGFEDGEEISRFDMVVRDGTVHIVWDARVSHYYKVYHVSVELGMRGEVQLVSPNKDKESFHNPSIAVEGESVVVAWMSGRWWSSASIAFRYFNGTAWGVSQTLGANLDYEAQSSPKVAIDHGTLHIGWSGLNNSNYTSLYWNATFEHEPPSSKVGPLKTFWIGPEGLEVMWSAEDDYYLGRVSLYYRCSKDNITWSGWAFCDGTIKVSSPRSTGTFHFVPMNGDGFYQFQTRAEDLLGNEEELSQGGDVAVALDTVAPTGSITILGDMDGLTSRPDLRIGMTYHDEMTGNLENATESTLLHISVSQYPFGTNRIWMMAEPEIELTLEGWDGTKTIWMQVMDLAGLVSPVYSVQIVLDTTPPNGTIVIAGGAHRIASSALQVDITFLDATSGVVSLRLSNDGVWDDEAWSPAETPLLWILEDGEGLRSVFLQVLDGAGWVSETVADHVIVDLEAPVGNVTIVSTTGITALRNIKLILEYKDNLSRVSQFRLSNNGSWRDEDWEEPKNLVSWTLKDGSGLKRVHLQLMDAWGHISETFSDEITLDLELPRASVMIVGDEDGVNSLDLQLRISYWDTTTSIERMRLSDRDDCRVVPWEVPSEARIFTLSPGDGRRFIYIQVMDSAGHVSQTQWDDILVDTTPPRVMTTKPLSNETLVWTYSEIFIIFSEPMDQASIEGHLHLKTGPLDIDSTFRWSLNDTMLSIAPYKPLDEGRLYRLELGTGVTDATGNPLTAPLVIKFETEEEALTDVPPEEGSDPTGVLQILIMIAIAVNVILAIMLMRRRQRPRRPS